MNEELKALFEGMELSASVQESITAIFESNVDTLKESLREEIQKELNEQNEATIEEKLKAIEESADGYIEEHVIPTIDKYISAVAEEWLKENKLTTEESIKVELAESFLKGIVGLAEEHNVAVPENSDSIVERTKAELAELRDRLDKQMDENISLKTDIVEMKKEKIIESVFADLTESQKDKIGGASAKLQFESEEQFTSALKTLREAYFPKAEEGDKVNEGEHDKGDDLNQINEDDQSQDEGSEYLKQLLKSY